MANLYITGTDGWLGSRLIEVASADHKVTPFKGDVRNANDCDAFFEQASDGILIHLAGVIHPKLVKEFYEVNTHGTLNMLKAAHKAGIKRWVVMSSNSPIGCNTNKDSLFDESSPYNPYLNYGKSKMEMEIASKQWAKDTNSKLVLIRSPWFYGPNQPKRQTLFFQLIKDGKFPLVGNGENKRSMVYIDNLCQGLLLAALNKSVPSNTYWIADETPYMMKDIIETVRSCLIESNFKVANTYPKLPGFISDIAYATDVLIQAMGLYNQKIHVLSEMNKSIACSVEKAKAELGYKPNISLKEGMMLSIKWCKENGCI
tara:strand:- start:6076 stop:7020 length:945 start_codon:yes stop_codon:yes gene_type:complete